VSQLVQILLTDEQAKLLAAAAVVAIRSDADEENGLITLEEDERTDLERLARFMAVVALNPSKFPLTGHMAVARKLAERRVDGVRRGDGELKGTVSRKNKRKVRQERRQRTHKVRRLTRRADAEAYNAARAQMEAELKEIQEIQEQRQREIETEAKYTLQDIMGNVVMTDIPESMIVAQTDEPETDYSVGGHEKFETPTIILPGSAEHLLADDPALD
jgi:hypothetical protein